jgi:hypothetical protein
MLADIVAGETGAADVLFLLAAIAAGLEVIFDFAGSRTLNFLALAVTLISVAFLLL